MSRPTHCLNRRCGEALEPTTRAQIPWFIGLCPSCRLASAAGFAWGSTVAGVLGFVAAFIWKAVH